MTSCAQRNRNTLSHGVQEDEEEKEKEREREREELAACTNTFILY